VRDLIVTVEAQWDGSLVPENWSFGMLTDTELGLLAKILEGINQGDVLLVDLNTMPDNPSCLKLPGLPDATSGVHYSATIVASGGAPPYTFYLLGALPPDLHLNRLTGELSGVPSLAGLMPQVHTFSVMVVDASSTPKTVTRKLSITVNPPPQITTVSLADAFMEQSYQEPLQVRGGSNPVSWEIVDGQLPAGLSLDPNTGIVAGVPPTARPAKTTTAYFTVEVADLNSATDTETFSLTVYPSQESVCDPAPPAPLGSPLLTLGKHDGVLMLFWSGIAGATTYDVVHGDLTELRATAGSFGPTVYGCLAQDANSTEASFAGADPGPGQAHWFLVRGENCGASGTYDSDLSMQPGSRDAGLDAAVDSCD
jgi:hypothetical protein